MGSFRFHKPGASCPGLAVILVGLGKNLPEEEVLERLTERAVDCNVRTGWNAFLPGQVSGQRLGVNQ